MNKIKIINKTIGIISNHRFKIITSVFPGSSSKILQDAHNFGRLLEEKMLRLRYKNFEQAYTKCKAFKYKPSVDQFINYLMKWTIEWLERGGHLSNDVKKCATFEITYVTD